MRLLRFYTGGTFFAIPAARVESVSRSLDGREAVLNDIDGRTFYLVLEQPGRGHDRYIEELLDWIESPHCSDVWGHPEDEEVDE